MVILLIASYDWLADVHTTKDGDQQIPKAIR
jgi:hypothetical protein